MYRCSLFIALLMSFQVYGKCAPSKYFSKEIDELQAMFKQDKKNPKVSAQKSLLLNLLRRSYSSTPKLEFKYYGISKGENLNYAFNLPIEEFRQIITKAIAKKSDWSNIKRPVDKSFLTNQSAYLEAISDNSYLLAWYYVNTNKTDQALSHLNKVFTDEYNKSLKTTSTYNSLCGGTPQFFWFKRYYKAILSIENPEKVEKIKKMYKEIEIHISTVPRFHRVT